MYAARGLKRLSDAETIRAKISSAYELEDVTDDDIERTRQMTFVLVGAGPAGVELAASMAQLAALTLRGYRADRSSVELNHSGRGWQANSSDVWREARPQGRPTTRRTRGEKCAPASKWRKSTTVESSPTVKEYRAAPCCGRRCCAIAHRKTACDQNGSGRKGFSRPVHGCPRCLRCVRYRRYVVDICNGRPVPGVAQAAIQQGRYVGRLIAPQLKGRETKEPFRYFGTGNMAVVGKNFAVLENGRIHTGGFLTWLVWIFLHLMQNRLRVQRQWVWSYLTGQRSSCLIPEVLTAGTHESERQVTPSAHD